MLRTAEETRAHFDAWADSYDASARTAGGPLEGYEESLRDAAASLNLPLGARTSRSPLAPSPRCLTATASSMD